MYLAADSLFRIIGFDSQLLFDSIITGINVFILFFALSYFLFNPVQKILKDRSEKIKTELENAKEKEKAAISMKNEYEDKLDKTRIEIENIMDEARQNAKKVSDSIIGEAKLEAANIVSRGNKEIELEKAKAMEDLKNQVVSISTLLASKIVKESVSAKDSDKLFKETLDEIGATTWQD